jgi:mono/diheme cytochrome c family protein
VEQDEVAAKGVAHRRSHRNVDACPIAGNPAVTPTRSVSANVSARQAACSSGIPEGLTMRNAVWMVFCLGLAATASAQDAKVTKGQQLFADQKCALCHSIGDKGNKKGPLDGVASKLSADEIRSWLTDAKGMTAKTKAARKPEMKAYALPKDDVDALVAYLETLKK